MIVLVTAHAADRFAERVRPGLSRREASDELARLAREFGRLVEWPGWVSASAKGRDSEGQFPIELSDGVLVVCVPVEGSIVPRALTVLTRAGDGQHRGAARRKQRRAKRLARTKVGERPVARAPRWDADAA